MIPVLTWWFLVEIFGLAAWPLAFRLFRRLPDRGYGISKALGLLLTGYLFWLLGILGFLRVNVGSILLSLIAVAGGALFFYSSPRSATDERQTSSSWLRANWKLVLITEAIFALSFGGWALYRAYVPRIMTAGGEKFMELTFLNSFQRSTTLPPHDPWLSGFAISYYYFGYLIMSMLIHLSGVAPAIGFNIGGALLFALTATGAFSVVYNLVASGGERTATTDLDAGQNGTKSKQRTWVTVALLGVVLVVFLSNWEGPLEVAHWKGVGSEGLWKWLDVADLDQPPPDLEGARSRYTRPGWWWWRASRVIFDYDLPDWPQRFDETADPAPHRRENIDEFPFFSFLLGDMHPHVLALPFIMLVLNASLTLFRIGFGQRDIRNWELGLFTLIFGALGFLNTWDLPIQWAIAVGAYTLGRFTRPRDEPVADEAYLPPSLRLHRRPVLKVATALSIGSLLLYTPFYVGFQSQAGGPLVHVHSSTRLVQFGIMFGPLLFILIAFLVWGIRRARRRGALSRGTMSWRAGLWTGGILLLLALGVLLVTALAIVLSPSLRELIAPGLGDEPPSTVALRYLGMRLSTPWVTLLLAGMVSVAVALLWSALQAPSQTSPQGDYCCAKLVEGACPDGSTGSPRWLVEGACPEFVEGACPEFVEGDDLLFSRAAQFSLLLVIAGGVLTLAPEYVYLKDVFGVRINTIFKFYYQAWILWAIASASIVYTLLIAEDGLRATTRRLFGGGLVLAIGLGLVYPLLSIPDRVKEFPEAPTLDGTVYFAQTQAADYAAVQWLNSFVEGAPVILETHTRGAYAYEGRVATQTGLPTLVGWGHHEWQWRGNTIEQDKRYPVIEELFSTTDGQRTLTLLDEYDIT